MTTAYLTIVVSMFIPIACAGYAKITNKGYNNRTPREFLNGLTGAGQRANYAQQNFYETFPAFAVGVVVAHQLQADQTLIDAWAMTYVAARVIYAAAYIADRHILRSLAWTVALVSIISLYFIGS